jgi:predicted Zn-dependent protease
VKNVTWASVSLAIVLVAILLFHSLRQMATPEPPPAAGAQIRISESNVDLRERVAEIFALAEARTREHKIDEAISLYQKGLQVDPWRLEYQLQLARLLKQIGLEEQAVEKARVVRQYAEQEELIAAADELLRNSKVPRESDTAPVPSQAVAPLEIVIVPIDKVDSRLLAELRDSLQARLGLTFTVAKDPLSLGGIDRTYADSLLTKLIEKIKATRPEQQYQRLLRELGFTEDSLTQYYPKVQFLEAVCRDSGRSPAQIEEFRTALATLQQAGQYDAERLLAELRRAHPLAGAGPVAGYLGITEADLFTRDYNFLYGWGGRGYAVMSYCRYAAAFNHEPPNRPRLLERAVKQAISSTFFILDIPRCTSPACARAYPHSLVEHDQKTGALCPDCQRALALAIARNR